MPNTKSPKLLTMMQQLIASPSISSVSPEFDQGNRGVIDLLATWLDELGFNIEISPIENQSGKANLIATLGSGPGGLVLAGHTDTVPCDVDKWRYDPFKLSDHDHRFYGLGSSDMKTFFAMCIEAVKGFSAAEFKQPLIILATADEESSMDGAKQIVRLGHPKARYAVIGEPTGLKPIHMHKGIIMESVRVNGVAGHSSNPALGVNAIEGLHALIGDLLHWRQQLQGRYRDERFEVSTPTLNLGLVHGGDNPNRICSHSELHFDLRLLPGMQIQSVRDELDQRLLELNRHSACQFERFPLIDGTDPMYTDPASELVKTLEKLTGHGAEAVAFCTEGPYLNALGMESVILGPGDIDQAHQANEYIRHDTITPCIELLRQLIIKFCCNEQAPV